MRRQLVFTFLLCFPFVLSILFWPFTLSVYIYLFLFTFTFLFHVWGLVTLISVSVFCVYMPKWNRFFGLVGLVGLFGLVGLVGFRWISVYTYLFWPEGPCGLEVEMLTNRGPDRPSGGCKSTVWLFSGVNRYLSCIVLVQPANLPSTSKISHYG